jgi:hypothetical protein
MATSVETMLPLYEGKMGHQFDYRAASFFGVGDTEIADNRDHSYHARVLPRYWVRESVVGDRLGRREWGTATALLGFRRVARNTDERTSIAAMIPFGAASYGWILSTGPTSRDLALLLAEYNSFVFDYLLRQFLSQPSVPQGTFGQLPTLVPASFAKHDEWLGNAADFVIDRAVRLSATGIELAGFAAELGCDLAHWDDNVRRLLRSELDAAFFHFYGIERDNADYIMETFPIVKRKDEGAYGEYRTKRLILESYDAMAEAIASGRPFLSRLDPNSEKVDRWGAQ